MTECYPCVKALYHDIFLEVHTLIHYMGIMWHSEYLLSVIQMMTKIIIFNSLQI